MWKKIGRGSYQNRKKNTSIEKKNVTQKTFKKVIIKKVGQKQIDEFEKEYELFIKKLKAEKEAKKKLEEMKKDETIKNNVEEVPINIETEKIEEVKNIEVQEENKQKKKRNNKKKQEINEEK